MARALPPAAALLLAAAVALGACSSPRDEKAAVERSMRDRFEAKGDYPEAVDCARTSGIWHCTVDLGAGRVLRCSGRVSHYAGQREDARAIRCEDAPE